MDRASLEDAWRQHKPSGAETASDGDDEPLLPPLQNLLAHISPNEEPAVSIKPSTTFVRSSFTIVAQLDRANPLTEARWVKTGEVENWILSLGIANGQDPKDPEQLSKWMGKINVVDPDPVSLPPCCVRLSVKAHNQHRLIAASNDPACTRFFGDEFERREFGREERIRREAHVEDR